MLPTELNEIRLPYQYSACVYCVLYSVVGYVLNWKKNKISLSHTCFNAMLLCVHNLRKLHIGSLYIIVYGSECPRLMKPTVKARKSFIFMIRLNYLNQLN